MLKTVMRAATRRFRRDRDGATAVEFAIVAAPFFLLTTAVLEAALFFFAQTIIEDGLLTAARDIRTGQFQNASMTESDLKDVICDRASVVANCTKIEVEVRTFGSFGAANFDIPLDGDGNLDSDALDFDVGGPSEVVMVRVFYPYQLYFPNFFSGGLANLPGNKRLIASATAFRTEPYIEEP